MLALKLTPSIELTAANVHVPSWLTVNTRRYPFRFKLKKKVLPRKPIVNFFVALNSSGFIVCYLKNSHI